jgi:hypothetical protein
MHTTPARRKAKEKRQQAKALKQEARTIETLATIPTKAKEFMIRAGEDEAQRLEQEAADLQERARLEDLNLWIMEKVKVNKSGSTVYKYWAASWREGGRVRNVHLGSCQKLTKEQALQKARKKKAEAMGLEEPKKGN